MNQPVKKHLHEYTLDERPVRMNRKWVMGVCVVLVIFIAIVGFLFTLIFMLRKGLW